MGCPWCGTSGCHASDVRMMPTRGGVEKKIHSLLVKYRGHNGDVREVCPSIVGSIQHKYITGGNCPLVMADNGFNRTIHRTQVNRHMRRIGYKRAIRGKNGTGKIEPLLDIYRVGRVLQGHTHLFGNGHEQIVEDFQ